ncbi:MAG: hypothetical protein IJX77_04845, partial [Ruminococcus sp.]|nr:hypothetical protein [Ruminococcus sp.]
MSISNVIDRMAEIKQEIKSLTAEYDTLQAQLQVKAEAALTDTKNKSVQYSGSDGNTASVTIADSVSVVAGELLPAIFGSVYPSMVKQEVKYTLKAPAKRILSAIWHKEYCEGSVAEIISSLSCDDKAKKVLMKKVKGIDFDKDKKNLIDFAGLADEEASDTAYLLNEAAAWENICAIMKVNHNGEINDDILNDIITKVNAAVNV